MTHQSRPADARGNAWIGAYERITVAQKLKLDHKSRVVDPLPEIYWATLEEAHILAQLALADQTVRLAAGGYLDYVESRAEESRANAAKMFDRRHLRRHVAHKLEANRAKARGEEPADTGHVCDDRCPNTDQADA